MLPKSALQTIAACMVYDEDMSKPAKMQVLRFIESASEKQLQHYIVHGNIVAEQEVEISEIAFLVPAAIIAAAAAAGRAIYNNEFSKAAKACQAEEGQTKKDCMKKFKLRGLSGKISAMKREMGKCNQTSRPDKCRTMFAKYIQDAEKQLKKVQAE